MNNNTLLTPEQLNSLAEQSRILGIIGCYVEDFCREEDTTLIGVVRLLAEYHQLKADNLYHKLEELQKQADELV
jgi:hypothetical protein